MPADLLTNPDAFKRFQENQAALTSSLSRLLAVSENYPDLKSNQNFLALQSQLEGTENRIAVARRDYIQAVQSYNTVLRTIPGRWIAAFLYPDAFRAFQQNQGQLTQALSRLMVVSERYPDLKANQNFLSLQSQLEGTENRISVARRDYIEAVRQYNTELRTIPGRWIAAIFYPDATVKENFTAESGAMSVPKVDFGKGT